MKQIIEPLALLLFFIGLSVLAPLLIPFLAYFYFALFQEQQAYDKYNFNSNEPNLRFNPLLARESKREAIIKQKDLELEEFIKQLKARKT